jgi:hypothetical protein
MAEESLKWNGPAVTAKLKAAQVAGVNRTMGQCVNQAKRSHNWQNRTGVLEGGITIVGYAAPEGKGVKGTWGVHDVRYALIHELGGVIRPVRAQALAIPQPDGSVRFVKSVTIPARPYLRPAADIFYPALVGNIRSAYEKGGRDGGA